MYIKLFLKIFTVPVFLKNNGNLRLPFYRRRLLTLMALAILFCPNISRAGEDIQFERISFEQGLFQSRITALFQDRKGCMWIGTSDGLNKYDGYRFTNYRFDPLDSTSISGNYIESIFEDHNGYFWIITSGGGINKLDPATEKFIHYRHDPDDPNSLSDDNISCILEDSRGNLWMGTAGGGLNLYDPASESFAHFRQNLADPASLSNNIVQVILEDHEGNLWIGTHGGGLNKLALPESPIWLKQGADSKAEKAPTPPLIFRHYFANGPTYHPDIYAAIDSLKSRSRLLASILYLQNYEESTDYLTIKKPTTVLIVSMGDGNAYGMADYGWIEKGENDDIVWKMDYEKTNHGGGGNRNRVQIDIVDLKPGQYKLRYRSDDQHSYKQWVTSPPNHSELWGIQIFAISKSEKAAFKQKLQRRISPNSLSHNWITALHQDNEGNLWIGTADGLSCLKKGPDNQQAYFAVFKHDSHDPGSLNHSYINSIYSGGNGDDDPLWIITSTDGLNRFDRKTGQVIRYPTTPAPESLSGDYLSAGKITALLRDRHKNLWIGTNEEGLSYLSAASQKIVMAENSPGHGGHRNHEHQPIFVHYQNDPIDLQSLSDNSISAIFEDRSGIIWVGTNRGGLNKINHEKRKFRLYTHSPDNPQSLSDKVVTAIFEDDSSFLWVGTAGGGLNKLESDPLNSFKYRYTHFKHNSRDRNSLSHNFVSAIYQDQSGNLWIGAYGGGLNLMDRKTKQFRHFQFDPHTSNSITGDYVNSISEDQYGQLWIGTNSGLSKFDRFTEKFTQYRHDANNPHSLSDNEVWAIYEDSYSQGKTLWIGTKAGGLNKFDRQNKQFVRYMRDFDNPFSLNNPAILSIYQDKEGNLWFGTYSGGLNKFNRETEQFTFFTERDGLANNMIFGILEDRRGNLWLSTNKGLSKFNPRENTFRNFDVYDGLQANEFNPGACCLGKNGEMFFGGVNGMNSFFPDSVKDNTYIPPIILTSFSIFGDSHTEKLNRAVFKSEPIVLSYRENFITIEFAALDYTNPRKNRYAYKLEGVNENWIDIGTRRFASFTNLDPGEYLFKVKGSNNDGIWNHKGASIRIIITPPFWKTWWFYLLVGTVLIFTAISLHIYRLKHNIKRVMEIEQVRTHENERVRAKAAHDFHDELGHKVTKINLFSEIAKRTVSDGPPEILDYLNRIGDTAKGLSGGMRDFIWTLDPEKDSLYEVAIRLKDFGDELFDKTGIAFRLKGLAQEMESVRLSMDWRRHITLIFKEAMNNVLKHSQCQNATLSILMNHNHLEITLEDDGKGIPKAILSGDNSDQGTEIDSPGNGLNNMRLRAQKLNGKISFLPGASNGAIIKFSGEIPQMGN